MKKTLFFNILALASFAMLMVSCNKPKEENWAEAIAKTYKGYSSASCALFSNMMNDDETIVLTQSESKKTVDLAFTSSQWGEFSIKETSITFAQDIYTVNGTGTCKMGHPGSEKEYACTVSGQIEANDDDATFVFTIADVMGGLTIEFQEGEMPVAYKVAGSYEGNTSVSCSFFTNSVEENQVVKLEYKSDDEVSLAYTSTTWGEFSIEQMKVTGENNNYSMEGNGICKMTNPHTGVQNEHPFSFIGSISDKALMSFSVEDVMGGLTIEFEGIKSGKKTNTLIF